MSAARTEPAGGSSARCPTREQTFLAEALREETVGGALLLAAATVAVIWASSPWSGVYDVLRTTVVGPAALHLDLDLATWAADGLLAVFFFVAGLELKRELVVGQLRRPAEAVLPMVAALCGMVVPALVYLAATLGGRRRAAEGWAVPMATDIAFALAVLAVLGSALPTSLRAFLLTLAVVDDLGAILVIAIGFTDDLDLARARRRRRPARRRTSCCSALVGPHGGRHRPARRSCCGSSSTRAACTPPSPASPSAWPPGYAPTRARSTHPRSGSSTSSGRSQPASRSRPSPSSPPASGSTPTRSRRGRSTTARDRRWSLAWSSASSSASSAAPGSPRGSPAPS